MKNILSWTPERVERLRFLCATSALCAEAIAVELGFPPSRNAVISKARRLKIDLPGKRTAPHKEYRRRNMIPGIPLVSDPPVPVPVPVPAPLASPSAPVAIEPERSPPIEPIAPYVPPFLSREELAMMSVEPVETVFVRAYGVGPAVAALRNDRCHWPEGEVTSDGFHFCMSVIAPGATYCKTHHRLGTLPDRVPRGRAA